MQSAADSRWYTVEGLKLDKQPARNIGNQVALWGEKHGEVTKHS